MTQPPEPARAEDLGAAARAVKEAVATLSRALTTGLTDVGLEVGRGVADELNEASRRLSATLAAQTRRDTQAARTRSELIAAARTVFAEKGYEAASVADLAAAAGYTKGALYAHFDSKEALFLAAVSCPSADDGSAPVTGHVHSLVDQRADVMLSLEAYLYALRHPGQREPLIRLARGQLDELVAHVHEQRTGGPGEATLADRDAALALAALSVMGSILVQLLPEDADIAGGIARVSQLLLTARRED